MKNSRQEISQISSIWTSFEVQIPVLNLYCKYVIMHRLTKNKNNVKFMQPPRALGHFLRAETFEMEKCCYCIAQDAPFAGLAIIID